MNIQLLCVVAICWLEAATPEAWATRSCSAPCWKGLSVPARQSVHFLNRLIFNCKTVAGMVMDSLCSADNNVNDVSQKTSEPMEVGSNFQLWVNYSFLIVFCKIAKAIRLKKKKSERETLPAWIVLQLISKLYTATCERKRKDRNQLLQLRNKFNATAEVLDFGGFGFFFFFLLPDAKRMCSEWYNVRGLLERKSMFWERGTGREMVAELMRTQRKRTRTKNLRMKQDLLFNSSN